MSDPATKPTELPKVVTFMVYELSGKWHVRLSDADNKAVYRANELQTFAVALEDGISKRQEIEKGVVFL
jgi:hypothetical protein